MTCSLHIDTGRTMRGGQWQVLYLLDGLTKAGHAATLLAPAGSPLLERARKLGVHAHPLRADRLWWHWRQADLVHAHDARAHTLAAFLSRKPLLVSRRVAFPLTGSFLSKWKYRRAAHYLAVSHFVKERLIEDGVNGAKITVVYDGVPVMPPTMQATAAPSDRILALDTSDAMKGADLIERASALTGRPVHFSQDLPRDLAAASVFVYISRVEGLGSAVLLAMAAGVPVIASRVGGLPELVEDGVTGLLTGNQPEEIAGAIRRLTEDPGLARAVAVRARERVTERFLAAHMVANTRRVYEKVLG